MIVDIHTHNRSSDALTLRAVGIHPWHALDADVAALEGEIEAAEAIGEIGLDFACDTPREAQMAVFRAQLSLAERHSKAVVLHCVRAFEETMRVLPNYNLQAVVFHGFIGSPEQAARAINRDYFLSFGERTFASPRSIAALRATPLSHLFVESDESSTPLLEIYSRLADLRGISTDELMEATKRNFEKLQESKSEL